ncbi:ribosome silencing factor [Sorangium sp. So ce131]|uniref:ribosome silencing factor n=1 Tax=Sorangium sp. So ce131 TaxID=3133282 RepID=UPI003F5F4CBE
MATKKDAGEGSSKPRAKAGSKAGEGAEPRLPARKKATTAKAGAAGRASSAAKPKRPASPRIRASHTGVGEPGAKAGRARRAPDVGDAGDAAERPAARAPRPTRGEGGAKAILPLAGRSAARKSPLAGPKRAGARRSAPPPAPQPSEAARELALKLAAAGLDKKAIGVEILEVVGRVDYADYLVIMTGRSDRHVHAIATGLEEATRKDKIAPLSMEGLAAATWVLIDFGDVVVHVFQEETRRLYDIEGLWIDAGRVPVPEESPAPGAQPAPRFDPS